MPRLGQDAASATAVPPGIAERGADVADQPGELAYVWNRVIADLSGTSAGSGASALSAQQRAFLRLTRPLGLIDGTALLAAPSEFAKDAIERILRRPISDALGRHLGFTVNLAVVVDVDAASGGTEVPGPAGHAPGRSPSPAAGAAGLRRAGRRDVPRDPPRRRRPVGRGAARLRRAPNRPTARTTRARPATAPGRRTPAPRRRSPRRAGDSVAGPRSAEPAEREVHLRHLRHRGVQPVRARRGRRRRRGAGASPTTRCSSGASPGWARRTCCTASGTTRSGCSRACGCGTSPARSSPTTSSTRCATTARWRSSAATATSTCCWWTTSSSWRARKAPRRSSSTPSTRCYNANKQIVISSDRPPKRLETLEDRMRTRFEWGLTTDIQPPELETRIAILRKKAALDRMNAPGRRARVHRQPDRAQHPRAGGRADPGHRVRLAEQADRRPGARRRSCCAT